MGDVSGVNDAVAAVEDLSEGNLDGALGHAILAVPVAKPLKGGKMIKEAVEEGGESAAKRTAAKQADEVAPPAPRKPAAGASPKPKPKPAAGAPGRRWKPTDFEGRRVFQRDDLIDVTGRDKLGRTNVTRMKRGLAPLGPDGKPLNLHHTTQRNDGSLAELTQTFHQKNSRVIHINSNKIPSGINRREFNQIKRRYWKARANDFAGHPFDTSFVPPSLNGTR